MNAVHTAALAPAQKVPTDDQIDELVTKKVFGHSTAQTCKTITRKCDSKNVPAVVMWSPAVSSEYIYLSVYTENIVYYSKLSRVVVSFNKEKGYIKCACMKSDRSCIHVQMTKAHLFANIPDVNIQKDEEKDDLVLNDAEGQTTATSRTKKMVEEYVRYQHDSKKIHENYDDFGSGILPSFREPSDIFCPFCPGECVLGPAELVSKGKIYDFITVKNGK